MRGTQLQESPRKCKLNHGMVLDIYQNASNEKIKKDKYRYQNSPTLLMDRRIGKLLRKSVWRICI